jgi:hypothetical protein
VTPPLKIVEPFSIADAAAPPAMLFVDGVVCDCVETCEVSETLYVDAMLAYARSLICGLSRVTSMFKL